MNLQYRVLCLFLWKNEMQFQAAGGSDMVAATTAVINVSIYKQCQYLISLNSEVNQLILVLI